MCLNISSAAKLRLFSETPNFSATFLQLSHNFSRQHPSRYGHQHGHAAVFRHSTHHGGRPLAQLPGSCGRPAACRSQLRARSARAPRPRSGCGLPVAGSFRPRRWRHRALRSLPPLRSLPSPPLPPLPPHALPPVLSSLASTCCLLGLVSRLRKTALARTHK